MSTIALSLRSCKRLWLVAALLLVPGLCIAQSSGYTQLVVKGRVQLDVPASWTINDAEQRQRAADLAEKAIGVKPTHVAALAVASYPAPSSVFVRVSIIKQSNPISQSDLIKELKSNRAGALRDLEEGWNEEAPTMWAGAAKLGIKPIGRPSFAAEPLGGKTALVIRYARTSPHDAAHVMRVAQFHVPLGPEKVLVTITQLDGDAAAAAAADRIRDSMKIQ